MPQELKDSDFTENVVLLNLSDFYLPNMDGYEMYEATRGYWVMNLDNAKANIEYALAVGDGVIREMYKVKDWYPAGTTYRLKKYVREDVLPADRIEFVGNIAPDEVKSKYIGKKVQTSRNPVHIIMGGAV